jgi:hypothetical protein
MTGRSLQNGKTRPPKEKSGPDGSFTIFGIGELSRRLSGRQVRLQKAKTPRLAPILFPKIRGPDGMFDDFKNRETARLAPILI